MESHGTVYYVYTSGEEEKMETETLELLGDFDEGTINPATFGVSASCHRVAVLDSHTEAVFIQMTDDFSVEDIEESFKDFRGLPQKLDLFSAPAAPIIVKEEENRPQTAYGSWCRARNGRIRRKDKERPSIRK